ncbi:MAG: P-II family nitrogen regulator [Deltaproteobacteria bacterium]|jgi:nitrogen regulatory protein P-II 1
MKGLIFYISNNDFASLIQVLQQNNVEGISYFDIGGRGKLKRGEIDKNIDEYDAYRTGKKFIPEFVIRKRVEVVVNDSDSQKIVEDVKKSGNIHGKVFIYDVHESSDLP